MALGLFDNQKSMIDWRIALKTFFETIFANEFFYESDVVFIPEHALNQAASLIHIAAECMGPTNRFSSFNSDKTRGVVKSAKSTHQMYANFQNFLIGDNIKKSRDIMYITNKQFLPTKIEPLWEKLRTHFRAIKNKREANGETRTFIEQQGLEHGDLAIVVIMLCMYPFIWRRQVG